MPAVTSNRPNETYAILAAALVMLLRRRLLAPVIPLLLAGCATADPQAAHQYGAVHPVPFACPAPGTKTIRTSTAGDITETWQAADPADPVACVRIGSDGQPARFLYTLPNHLLPTSADEKAIRSAWAKAFDGATEEGCYDYTGVLAAPPRGMPSNHSTWSRCVKQLGETTIAINNVPTRLIAFRMTDRGTAGSDYAADFTYFYDPAHNLFIRSDVTRIRRFGPGDWTRTIAPSPPA